MIAMLFAKSVKKRLVIKGNFGQAWLSRFYLVYWNCCFWSTVKLNVLTTVCHIISHKNIFLKLIVLTFCKSIKFSKSSNYFEIALTFWNCKYVCLPLLYHFRFFGMRKMIPPLHTKVFFGSCDNGESMEQGFLQKI